MLMEIERYRGRPSDGEDGEGEEPVEGADGEAYQEPSTIIDVNRLKKYYNFLDQRSILDLNTKTIDVNRLKMYYNSMEQRSILHIDTKTLKVPSTNLTKKDLQKIVNHIIHFVIWKSGLHCRGRGWV